MNNEKIKALRHASLEVINQYYPLMGDEMYLIVKVLETDEVFCTTDSELKYFGISI